MIRRVRELILAGVTLALPLIAHAENPNVAAADEVYKRGAAAYDRGDYAAAASEFARAVCEALHARARPGV